MKVLILAFLLFNFTYAHKLYILADDDGKTLHVKSYFTKKSFCQNCQVKILNEDKKVLFKGVTDKEGEANFPFNTKNIYIDVTAPMGHKNRIFYKRENQIISESEDTNESHLKLLLALGIIGFIFFVLKFIKK